MPREPVVLVVENDPDLRELTQMGLSRAGMVVVSATDGRHALQLREVVRPDVIVSEMVMPVMDGLAFLREHAGRPDAAPVVALSSLRPYLVRARELGADATLVKPFDLTRLIAVVRELAAGTYPAEEPPAPLEAALEEARLRAILDLRLDIRAPEPSLDRFVELVAAFFRVPIALVSIVTEESQFWTSGCGIPEDLREARGTRRDQSFCTHAVAARAALIVQDTTDSGIFANNPFVTTRGVRFYAGVPLIARHGEAVGTLCLLDYEPRVFSHADLELLSVFGRCVLSAFEWREVVTRPDIPLSAMRYLHYVDRDLDCLGASAFADVAVVEGARSAEREEPLACVAVAVPARRLQSCVEALRGQSVDAIVGRLGHSRLGWLVHGMSAAEARQAAIDATGPHVFAYAVELEHYPGTIRLALQRLEASLGDAGLV